MLQETLSDIYKYSIELALLNWNTEMTFRIAGDNGESDFESFNPSTLNNVPLLMRSNTEYIKQYKKKHKNAKASDYEYMQVEGETRKVKYDLKVTVGAGMPNNKAFRYNVISESYAKKAITKREYRKYLISNLGLNVAEVPESLAEQQELQIYSDNNMQKIQQAYQNSQGADIAGVNNKGNISLNQVKEVYNG